MDWSGRPEGVAREMSTAGPPRIAIVTGASRLAGIGAAIAAALAAEGWFLLLTGYSAYDRGQGLAADDDGLEAVAERVAARAPGVRVAIHADDLADPAAAERIVGICHDRLGPPVALVNNAALSERGGIGAIDADHLDRHWAVNARTPALLTAAFARRFRRPTGSVVNLTSGQALGPMPDELAYAVSKGALEALTVQAAAELAPKRIRVNAVDPGPTDTGWMTEVQRSELAAPLGRVGMPTDAARLVRFLCSDESRWITGQILRSRGGL